MPRTGRRESKSGPLDLVPIMNLVTILIPFLLMSAHYVSLSVIDAAAPSVLQSDEPVPEPEPEDRLGLKVLISGGGYTLSGDQPMRDDEESSITLGCLQMDCADGAYDTDALRALLAEIKDHWPGEDMVVLVPGPTTSYETIVRTMDAMRADGSRDLFPSVIVAGGAAR